MTALSEQDLPLLHGLDNRSNTLYACTICFIIENDFSSTPKIQGAWRELHAWTLCTVDECVGQKWFFFFKTP